MFRTWEPAAFAWGSKCYTVPLWKEFDPADRHNSAVRRITWERGVFIVTCGVDTFTEFVLNYDGGILAARPCQAPAERRLPEASDTLPACPGRENMAAAVLQTAMTGKRRMLVTKDGVLALERPDGSIYSIGSAWNGPVHDITSTRSCSKVYGVAGDNGGMVFSYDDQRGLRWLGRLESPGPSALCLSGDDRWIAIGTSGSEGTVYIFG